MLRTLVLALALAAATPVLAAAASAAPTPAPTVAELQARVAAADKAAADANETVQRLTAMVQQLQYERDQKAYELTMLMAMARRAGALQFDQAGHPGLICPAAAAPAPAAH